MGVLDLLDSIGYVLDTPGALTRGALAGRFGDRLSGRDLLEEWGALDENREGLDGGDVAGFAADMILDPLNLLSGGTLAAVRGANRGIRGANKASEALRAAGAMPEEIAALTKVVDETGAPRRMFHGTPHVFDKPDPSKLDPDALYGPGYYTTADPSIASEYSDKGSALIDSARQSAEQDIEWLNRRLPKLREAEASGLPDDTLARHGMTRAEKIAELEERLNRQTEAMNRHPQPNVRMQYLDARNPFDIANTFSRDESRDILMRAIGDGDEVDYMLGPIQHGVLSRNRGDNLYDMIGGQFGGNKAAVNQALRDAGYDAITHRGGGLVGGGNMHDVVIALDPSQVYSPYIAPALRPEHRTSPLLAALAANNLGQFSYDLGVN